MINRRVRIRVLTVLTLCWTTGVVHSDDWPNWRGPDSNSVVGGSGYPTQWGEEENILWKVTVPGWGTSTPAIWGERIFVSFDDAETNGLMCLNRRGKEQWTVALGSAASNKNRKASASNPSPVTDGQHVYAYYKSGDLACLTLDGKKIWELNLQEKYGPDRLNWDLGTSPVLTSDLIVIAVMHQGPSYVVAFDKLTGKEVWKQGRDLGAPAEARDSYTTPMIVRNGEQEMVVVLGADFVTAYEASTGNEIWRVGDLNPDSQRNFRSIASPAVSGSMIIAPYARGDSLTAIRLGGKGDVTETHVAWTEYGISADVPTPVAQDGKVYLCGDRGEVHCVDGETGKLLWTESLPRNRYVYSASPVIADGRLYVTREDGRVFILQLSGEPRLIGEASVRENTLATPAFADGRIYLRTSDYLICIGTE